MAIKKIPHRLVVYPRDICNILGYKNKAAQKLLKRIRESLGKSDHQFVTVKELCQYLDIEEEALAEFMTT
jgi:hypothetical protein